MNNFGTNTLQMQI